MLINEVARRTGFSRDTIRYYQRIGLLELGTNSRGPNNYRHYGGRELERLRLVAVLKEFGFTLREIAYLFRLGNDRQIECGPIGQLVDKKISAIDDKMRQLAAMRTRLVAAKKDCEGDCTRVLP